MNFVSQNYGITSVSKIQGIFLDDGFLGSIVCNIIILGRETRPLQKCKGVIVMELPQRKPNRIDDYDYSQHGAYFVTICTHERRKILSDIVGDGFPVPKPIGIIAEEMIRRISDKYPTVAIDKYMVMPDHIHLLLRIDNVVGTGDPSPTLGNIIGWYKYQVTKQVNVLLGIAGEKVFQRSYYDHVIRNQRDYDEIWQYIENNPKKWLMQNRGFE